MNPRIEMITEWDGSFTVKLDGEPVLIRQPYPDAFRRAQYLDLKLALDTAPAPEVGLRHEVSQQTRIDSDADGSEGV